MCSILCCVWSFTFANSDLQKAISEFCGTNLIAPLQGCTQNLGLKRKFQSGYSRDTRSPARNRFGRGHSIRTKGNLGWDGL
ncbi:MAG: hypothetical protein ACJAZC_002407 [Cryomorphaceae bacterium]|jgi:hypothetical protein